VSFSARAISRIEELHDTRFLGGSIFHGAILGVRDIVSLIGGIGCSSTLLVIFYFTNNGIVQISIKQNKIKYLTNLTRKK